MNDKGWLNRQIQYAERETETWPENTTANNDQHQTTQDREGFEAKNAQPVNTDKE